MKKIDQRTRYYIAVEGESEQSLVKLLQIFSDQLGLHIHLDCEVLSGGGYKAMLEKTVKYRKRKYRYEAKASFLLLDADRAENRHDSWSLDKLREEAEKQKIHVCLQQPNHEGLLLRMIPGNESLRPTVANAKPSLLKKWPTYQKPADAQTLRAKFSLEDLRRVAKSDSEIKNLLSMLGFL